MQNYAFRLKPGQDLFDSLGTFIKERHLEAGCVLSGVGGLTHATLRLANRDFYTEYDGHFEIVSITGTVSIHGSHLHIAISDQNGKTIDGYLVSSPCCFSSRCHDNRWHNPGGVLISHPWSQGSTFPFVARIARQNPLRVHSWLLSCLQVS